MDGYDSRADTLAHSLRVGALLVDALAELMRRAVQHDLSKLDEPERSTYDTFVPLLQQATFGTEEYRAIGRQMGVGLQHHYAHNRHHPEHFPDGIDGMTLVDLLEMLADWKAASERRGGGDFTASLATAAERFAISPQLAGILRNTAAHFGWLGVGGVGIEDSTGAEKGT